MHSAELKIMYGYNFGEYVRSLCTICTLIEDLTRQREKPWWESDAGTVQIENIFLSLRNIFAKSSYRASLNAVNLLWICCEFAVNLLWMDGRALHFLGASAFPPKNHYTIHTQHQRYSYQPWPPPPPSYESLPRHLLPRYYTQRRAVRPIFIIYP